MEGFTTISKPSLVDPNLMMQVEMQKAVGGSGESMCSRIWTKLQSDISSFIYNNFWILLIIVIVLYLLWRRYVWYRTIYENEKLEKIKRRKEAEKEKKIKMFLKLQQRQQLQQEMRREERKRKKEESKEYGTWSGIDSNYAMC